MNRQKIISREYKLVLKSENFTGHEPALKERANLFEANLKTIINPFVKKIKGSFDTIKSRRKISFYDTKEFFLNKKGYVFRERKNIINADTEVTLKFRHADQYISQDRNMAACKKANAEIKFEEDIKAPFITLYSFSTTQAIDDNDVFRKIKHIIKLYPGLADEFSKDQIDEKLLLVNESPINEIVMAGPIIQLQGKSSVDAECALICWYNSEPFETNPVIVEFSFRYGNDKEKYNRETAQKAYDIFLLIQKEMKQWISTDNFTKTGFVYGG